MTEREVMEDINPEHNDGMKYTLRMATLDDAKELVSIYEYYVKETAITFEYEVPTVEEFRERIENTLKKFPYLVVERSGKPGKSENSGDLEDAVESASDGEVESAGEPASVGELESTGDTCRPEILGYAYASAFHPRDAYKWCAEMSIYLKKECRREGLGRVLYEELESRLKQMGILNLNACIGYPDKEDEHLTFGSVKFHEKMGYSMVGEFHKCGYKFGRWYNMVWMEKHIGEHVDNPQSPCFQQ